MSLRRVALPEALIEVVDAEIRQGHAQSRAEFLEVAILNQVALFRSDSVDRQFAAMASDDAYLREAVQIAEELSASDWEALQSA